VYLVWGARFATGGAEASFVRTVTFIARAAGAALSVGLRDRAEGIRRIGLQLSTAAIGLAMIFALSACAGGRPGEGAARTVVRVTERDFRISAPHEVSSGDVVFRVKNRGPDAHELLVVRTDDQLPFRGDGVTVDEDSVERADVGVLEPGQPGGVRELQAHLAPGRYVLFCNMSGHYLGGMRAVLVVR
jgi:hypothetical protein